MCPPENTRERVIMFADVVGSTQLYESLGNTVANPLIRNGLQALTEVVELHSGEVGVEIGDEIMCYFNTTDDAAAAACEMHAKLHERAETGEDKTPMKVRIGIHVGPVRGNSDDLMGETAKIAQWAARNAKPDQTLVTLKTFEALPRIYKAVSRYVDDETWNFISLEHMEIFELIWDVESVTAYRDEETPTPDNRYHHVRFSIGTDAFILDEDRPVISVGRTKGNDLMIPHDLVSRQHFSAQFSRGRCTITDNSTNGTFIITDAKEKLVVRRDTFPLRGSGRIFLGEPSESKEDYAIHYTCAKDAVITDH